MNQEDQIKQLGEEINSLKQKFASAEKTNEENEKKKKAFDPVFATIVVAIIGFIGTTIGNMINNSNSNALEARKFEFDIIKKGLDQPTTQEERIKYLALLSSVKLIKDKEIRVALDSIVKNPNRVPNLSEIDNTLETTVRNLAVKKSTGVMESDTALIQLEFVNGDTGQVTILAPWFQLADTTNTYNGAWGGTIDNESLFPISLQPFEKRTVHVKLSARTLTLNPGKYLAFEYFYIDSKAKKHDVWGDFNIHIAAHGDTIDKIEEVNIIKLIGNQ